MENTLEERVEERVRIMSKYPDRVPVILNSKTLSLVKKKFIVPENLTISDFTLTLRKNLRLNEAQTLFLIINRSFPKMIDTLGIVYNREKATDGFLYITLSEENTFG